MGRLIDADVLREEVYSWGMNDYEPSDFTDAIDNAPTVEAIPKDQYEARLKADVVAMLTDLKKEIDKIPINPNTSKGFKLGQATAYDKCEFLIRQKINELKGDFK